jgi:thiol-disulfide isomerase/thioredoxin
MRPLARLLIAVAVLGLGAALAVLVTTHPPATQRDASALFTAQFPDQNGAPQALAQWQGKVVVVNFWATWCPPCREEMPELSDFQDQYRDRGLVVLGISTDDVAKIGEFAKSSPVSYPLLAGDFRAMELAESLGNDRSALPYTVLLGRDGRVKASYVGRLELAELEKDVLAQLAAR